MDPIDLTALFADATQTGDISQNALDTIQQHNLQGNINAALGVDVTELGMGESVIVTIDLDDSSSIRFAGNAPVIRASYNDMLAAIEGAKARNNVLVRTIQMNKGQMHPYVSLKDATRLDTSNYNPSGWTPLRDTLLTMLAGVLGKLVQNKSVGVNTRSISGVITDGKDEGSREAKAKDIKVLVDDLLSDSETNIVFAMGIDDGSTDFRKVFGEMGIPDEWILTPQNSPSEIRAAFDLVSRTTQAASQSAQQFSAVATGGGFGGV